MADFEFTITESNSLVDLNLQAFLFILAFLHLPRPRI